MELAETQKWLQELESKELRDIPEKVTLQKEFQKKMDAAVLKVQVFLIWQLRFANICLSLLNLNTLLVKLSPVLQIGS